MTDSKAEARYVQDKPGTSCHAKSKKMLKKEKKRWSMS